MWKTVSMRIRGASTELEKAGLDTEGLVTSTSKLQSLIKGMTGFDILEKDQKTFKSMYDIILGIGKEYKNLSDIDQASLLEALAGKRQGNALASALNNIEDIQKAYEASENSAGSAQKEFDNYTKSIQYSMDVLKASFQELSSDTINSNFAKGFVDFANILVNVVDKVGLLNVALIALGAKFGTTTMLGINSFSSALIPMIENMGIASTTATTLGTALSVALPVAGIIAGITIISKAYDALNVTLEEQIEKAEKAKEKYEEATGNLDTITNQLDNQSKLIDELNSKDLPQYVKDAELEKLKKVTEQLTIQQDLAEKEVKRTQEKSAIEASKVINKYSGLNNIENKVNEYTNNADLTGNNAILLGEKDNLASIIAGYKELNKLKDEAYGQENEEDMIYYSDCTKEIEDTIWETVTALQEQQTNIQEYYNTIKDMDYSKLSISDKQIIDSYNDVSEAIEYIYKLLSPEKWYEIQNNISDSSTDSAEKVVENTNKIKKSLSDMFSNEDNSKAIDTYQSKIKTLNDAIEKLSDKKIDASSVVDLIQEFGLDSSKIDLSTNSFAGLNSQLKQACDQQYNILISSIGKIEDFENPKEFETFCKNMRSLSNSTKESTNQILSFEDALKKVETSSNLLQTINKDIKEIKTISESTLSSIANSYPQLQDEIAKYQTGIIGNKELITSLTEVYNTDADNYKQAMIVKMDEDNTFYTNVLSENSDLITNLNNEYNIDLTNYASLAKAKLGIDQQLIKNLSSAWSDFYGVQYDAMTGLASIKGFDPTSNGMSGIDLDNWYKSGQGQAYLQVKDATDKYNSVIDRLNNISIKSIDLPTSLGGSGIINTLDGKEKTQINFISTSLEKLQNNVTDAEKALESVKNSKSNNYYSDLATSINNVNSAYEDLLGNKKKDTGLYGALEEYNSLFANSIKGLSKDVVNKIKSNEEFSIEEYDSETGKKIQDAISYLSKINDIQNQITDAKQKMKDNTVQLNQNSLEQIKLQRDTLSSQIEQASNAKDKNKLIDDDLKLLKKEYELEKSLAKSDEERAKLKSEYLVNKANKKAEKYQNNIDEYQITYDINQSKIDSGNLNIKEKNKFLKDQESLAKQIYDNNVKLAKTDIEKVKLANEYKNTLKEIDTSTYQDEIDMKQKSVDLQKQSLGYLQDEQSQREKLGDTLNEADYDVLIAKNKSIKVSYQEMYNSMSKELDKLVKNGDISEMSPKWLEWEQNLGNIKATIQDVDSSLIDLSKTQYMLKWNNFDKAISKMSATQDRLSDIQDLLSGIWVNEKTGSLTSDGITNISLLGKTIVQNTTLINKYRDALNQLDTDYKNGLISLDDYTELTNKYSSDMNKSAKSVKDANQSIIDIEKERINIETELYKTTLTDKKDALEDELKARKEIVDAQVKSLEAEKEAYQLANKTKESNKSLAQLQSKIATLKLNTSDDNRANHNLLLQLESEYNKKKTEIKQQQVEDKYDAQIDALNDSIDLQEKETNEKTDAIDKELDIYEKAQKEKISLLESSTEQQKLIISQYLADSQIHVSTTISTINDIASRYGITLSSSLTSPFISMQEEITKCKNMMEELNNIDLKNNTNNETNILDTVMKGVNLNKGIDLTQNTKLLSTVSKGIDLSANRGLNNILSKSLTPSLSNMLNGISVIPNVSKNIPKVDVHFDKLLNIEGNSKFDDEILSKAEDLVTNKMPVIIGDYISSNIR